MMMVLFLLIGLSFLVALLLGLFFFALGLSRGTIKRKRDERVKPKRDENDRLILSADGELIDLPDPSDEDDHAQRNRNS